MRHDDLMHHRFDFQPVLLNIVLVWDGLAAGGVSGPALVRMPCIACFRTRGSCRPQAHMLYAFPRARATSASEI